MAMTNCPGCNNDVSDDAKTCPACGHPLSRPKGPSNKEFKKPVNALSVVTVVVVCLGCGLLCSPVYRLYVSAQVSATKTAPLSNVKQIGDGLALYVADNDDLYPSRFSSTQALQEILKPYLKNDE